jgi:hypothetical protein
MRIQIKLLPSILLGAVVGLSSGASAQTAKDLIGTWILVGTNSTMTDGSQIDPPRSSASTPLVWRCLGSQQATNGIVAMSRDKTRP